MSVLVIVVLIAIYGVLVYIAFKVSNVASELGSAGHELWKIRRLLEDNGLPPVPAAPMTAKLGGSTNKVGGEADCVGKR